MGLFLWCSVPFLVAGRNLSGAPWWSPRPCLGRRIGAPSLRRRPRLGRHCAPTPDTAWVDSNVEDCWCWRSRHDRATGSAWWSIRRWFSTCKYPEGAGNPRRIECVIVKRLLSLLAAPLLLVACTGSTESSRELGSTVDAGGILVTATYSGPTTIDECYDSSICGGTLHTFTVKLENTTKEDYDAQAARLGYARNADGDGIIQYDFPDYGRSAGIIRPGEVAEWTDAVKFPGDDTETITLEYDLTEGIVVYEGNLN